MEATALTYLYERTNASFVGTKQIGGYATILQVIRC